MKQYGKQYYYDSNYLKFLSKNTETTGERKNNLGRMGEKDGDYDVYSLTVSHLSSRKYLLRSYQMQHAVNNIRSTKLNRSSSLTMKNRGV
jgi:hypothetical protein